MDPSKEEADLLFLPAFRPIAARWVTAATAAPTPHSPPPLQTGAAAAPTAPAADSFDIADTAAAAADDAANVIAHAHKTASFFSSFQSILFGRDSASNLLILPRRRTTMTTTMLATPKDYSAASA